MPQASIGGEHPLQLEGGTRIEKSVPLSVHSIGSCESFYSGLMSAYDDYEPPWHTWTSENWDEYFAMGGETCLLCDERVDDRKFAVAVETHRAWVPLASSVAFAHVECLRRVVPQLAPHG